MKKIHKTIVFIAFAAIVFHFLINFFLTKYTPDELQDLLVSTKENEEIMDKIGGYDSCKSSYNSLLRDAKKEYDFEMTIFGTNGYINFNGLARFSEKENQWLIVKKDTAIKVY